MAKGLDSLSQRRVSVDTRVWSSRGRGGGNKKIQWKSDASAMAAKQVKPSINDMSCLGKAVISQAQELLFTVPS